MAAKKAAKKVAPAAEKEEEKKDPLMEEDTELEEDTLSEESEDETTDETEEEESPKPKTGKPAQRVISGAELQKSFTSDIERTKAALEKQPKVTFMIPLAPGEKPGAYETVSINGYRLTIKKGAMVEIPKQVAEMLADHYAVELNAGKEYRSDRDSHVEEALN